jgi:hypothetical protein
MAAPQPLTVLQRLFGVTFGASQTPFNCVRKPIIQEDGHGRLFKGFLERSDPLPSRYLIFFSLQHFIFFTTG